ncbi:MAG: M48 family metallopeptidase [Myxococcales bacterium]|nr:M48 family metallopeptidase [Myxococcales bacterium]MCB9708197.1 M48 family metallopeptidase [Myxococcales bacterium]
MFELARRNRIRSLWLFAAMVLLLVAMGYFAAELVEPGLGIYGIAIAVVVALVLGVFSYFAGSSILLAASGAKAVGKENAPQLINVLEEMVIASGLGATPSLYIIDSPVPNAMATGRDPQHAAVAVTEGLLARLDRDELQAVIAHEVAHVYNRDILFMTLLSVMAGSISILSDISLRTLLFRGRGRRNSRSSGNGGGQAQLIIMVIGLVLVILGPIVARIVYFAASRSREYLADAGSAIFTRNPGALASALGKISQDSTAYARLPVPKAAHALLIVGPTLLGSHPPIEKRIAILNKLSGAKHVGYRSYAAAFQSVVNKDPGFIPQSVLGLAQMPTMEQPVGASGDADLHREAVNAVRRAADFRVVPCPCGAVFKLPPGFPDTQPLACLRCQRPLGATD